MTLVETLAKKLDWEGWSIDPNHVDPIVRGWSKDARAKSIADVRKILTMLRDHPTPEIVNADHAFKDRIGSSTAQIAIFQAMIDAALTG